MREPDGRRAPLNLPRLATLILSPTTAYWCAGSGDLGLEVADDLLSLVWCEALAGFLVTHYEGSKQWVVTRDDASAAQMEVCVGGEPFLVPKRATIEPEQALIVVRHFATDGKRSPELAWVDYWEIDWP